MSINIVIKRMFLLMAVFILVLPSCSIKENREECPCTLTLDLSRCPAGQSVTIIGYSGNNTFCRTVMVSKDSTAIMQSVEKGNVHLCAYSGIAEMVSIDKTLIIPKGDQCDPVLMSSYDISCRGESVIDTLRLHKQYAEITIRFIDVVEEVFPYEIVIKGNIHGIEIPSLNPLKSPFEFRPQAEGEFGREFKFLVPRQTDDSLSIEIWQNERFLSTINLGEEIHKTRFNWNKEALDNITVEIDYSHSEMYVQITDWQDSISNDYVI